MTCSLKINDKLIRFTSLFLATVRIKPCWSSAQSSLLVWFFFSKWGWDTYWTNGKNLVSKKSQDSMGVDGSYSQEFTVRSRSYVAFRLNIFKGSWMCTPTQEVQSYPWRRWGRCYTVLRGTARKKEQQREANNGTITEEEKPLRRKLTVNSAMPSSGRID